MGGSRKVKSAIATTEPSARSRGKTKSSSSCSSIIMIVYEDSMSNCNKLDTVDFVRLG